MTGGVGPAAFAATQAAFAATLTDEWVRAGITEAVVCPGSRSTPLVLALSARPELTLHVRLDERSAGFYGLGLALATGRPAVVCTTSGTAAAELHPSVLEADLARVPMLVCTADRPPELQGVGAPQTADQIHLFGRSVRWFCGPGVPEAATASAWRSIGSRAVAESLEGPLGPGPVHLDLAFRDPLTAEPGPLPPGRPGDRPWHSIAPAQPVFFGPTATPAAGPSGEPERWMVRVEGERVRDEDLGVDLGSWLGSPGIVVAGAGAGPPELIEQLAAGLGWPVLADPRSGCRYRRPGVVAAADALLRDPEVRRRLMPGHVVLLGAPWASKVLGSFLAEAAHDGAEVVGVDPAWSWVDPDRLVTTVVRWTPSDWLFRVIPRFEYLAGRPDQQRRVQLAHAHWLGRWERLEEAAQVALEAELASMGRESGDRLNEPRVARTVYASAGEGRTVMAASSMPVRDLEWYGAPARHVPQVLANRGANGIDGVTSTALGVAAAGREVVCLLGDLAFLHDVSALVGPLAGGPTGLGVGDVAGTGPPATGRGCTLVVVDNRGGGIFSFLPQARQVRPEVFDRLFGTPPSADVARVAAGFGLPVVEVTTTAELERALADRRGRRDVAVVRALVPDRDANVAVHDRLHAAVARAAASVLAAGNGH